MAREKKAAKAKQLHWPTEAALCADFISIATRDGTWIAYPETGGFDILLVRKLDGFQIGVEAKLTLNAKVVTQALPQNRWWDYAETGPDCRAVLVPHGKVAHGLATICDWLGVTVITLRPPPERGVSYERILPRLPEINERYGVSRHWHEWCPVHRVRLPTYVPDVVAGDRSPVKLTAWKIKAIKLAILLESRPVTRSDFKQLGLDPTRWTNRHTGWLQPTPAGYVAGPRMPDFRAQHPVVYGQIKADAPKWMAGTASQGQLSLFALAV